MNHKVANFNTAVKTHHINFYQINIAMYLLYARGAQHAQHVHSMHSNAFASRC